MKMTIFILIYLLFSSCQSFAGATGEVLGDTAKGAVVGGVVGAATTKVGQKVLTSQFGDKAAEKIGQFFDSPPGILTMAGIATVYSGVLYNAAADQEEESENNIKKIDRVLAEFKDSYAAFCPGGYDDLKVPECYCYLPKGGPNPNRTKSQICQDLWAKNSYRITAIAGSYSGLAKFTDPVGCLTVNGQFDETCRCKKFLDSKGNNACRKSVSIAIPNGIGAAMMSSTGLKDVMQLAANASNGNPMFNNFGTGQLGVKAVATDNLRNQLIAKIASAAGSSGGLPKINEGNVNQLAKAILGEKNFANIVNSSSAPLASIGATPLDPKMEKEVKAAAAKAGLDFTGSGKGLTNKKAENKEQFAFNMGADGGAQNGAGQTQDFPEQQKTYKIKGDISKQTDTSIFEIISNRYIQSGLKRLFEE